MSVFRKRLPSNFVPVHPHNATNKDWIIVLEAGTITGPTPSRLRVAGATQERKVVKKYDMLMHAEHYLCGGRLQPENSCALLLPATLQARCRKEAGTPARRRNRRIDSTIGRAWSE